MKSIIRNLLYYACLLVIGTHMLTASDEVIDADQRIKDIFSRDPITEAVYKEYLLVSVAKLRLNESKFGLVKDSNDLASLEAIQREARTIFDTWSYSAKEILRIPHLTREQVSDTLGIIYKYREINGTLTKELYECIQKKQKEGSK